MELQANWRYKTLENLEKDYWGDPTFNSYLVVRTHELRKIPLNAFTIEDLRINIGQNFSLDYLMPLAIEELQKNLFADGDYYEGDLLQAVLKINSEFWINNRPYWVQIHELISELLSELDSKRIEYKGFMSLKLNM